MPSAFYLPRRTAPLPDQKDFYVNPNALDAISAWKNFGGLTLSQA